MSHTYNFELKKQCSVYWFFACLRSGRLIKIILQYKPLCKEFTIYTFLNASANSSLLTSREG